MAEKTIFPREEKADVLFNKILNDPWACEKLQETFCNSLALNDDPDGIPLRLPARRRYDGSASLTPALSHIMSAALSPELPVPVLLFFRSCDCLASFY